VDAAGNVYVGGAVVGTVDLDPGPGTFLVNAQGTNDGFVVKLDANGHFLWGGLISNARAAHVKSLTLDGSGNVYVLAGYGGQIDLVTDLDPGPGTFNVAGDGAAVVKLDSAGQFLWARTSAGSIHVPAAITLDALGNIHVAGGFIGSVDFDPGPGVVNLTSAGATDLFAWKLDSNGDFVWARSAGGAGGDGANGIAVDAAGHVYVSGLFEGTADFDPGSGTFHLTSAGADAVLWKLDANGNFRAAHRFGSTGHDAARGVALDAVGALYLFGEFNGTVDFDPGPGSFLLNSVGVSAAFVTKHQPDGTFAWAVSAGGTGRVHEGADGGPDIAIDPAGNVITTGRFSGTADFDPGPDVLNLTSNGGFDAFVWKLTQNLVDISGRVFVDANNNGLFEAGDGDLGLGGVRIEVWNQTQTTLFGSTVTQTDGTYLLNAKLQPGDYRLVQVFDELANGLLDGKETAGTLGGAVFNNQDSNIIDFVVQAGDADASGYDFAEIRPSRLQGLVWEDFNDDGDVNFGESAIAAVAIAVAGVDDRGNAVNLALATDAQGIYEFINLRPGNYTIIETQPSGFADGKESLGTVNGVLVGDASVNDQFSGVVLARPGSDAVNYNFGERPEAEGAVASGQTATIGFWQNRHGQSLIKSLNGGPNDTQLANWLAATFPNMYGLNAGASNLTGKTNEQIATLFTGLFKRTAATAPGGPPKLDAQVLATALAVYVTNETLAGTTAAAFGFQVTANGVGYATFNVGDNGAAFGVANNTEMTIMDILLATNERTKNGILYDLDGSGQIDNSERDWRVMANEVYTAINEQGQI
jgi:hypothetical protein